MVSSLIINRVVEFTNPANEISHSATNYQQNLVIITFNLISQTVNSKSWHTS